MALPEEWEWVEELIQEEGRAMTVTLPGSASDTDKPWRGNATGTPTNAMGVFFFYKAGEVDGNHVKRGDQRVRLVPDDVIDIEAGTKIIDSLDSSSWNVIDIQKISHRSSILAYILQIRQ